MRSQFFHSRNRLEVRACFVASGPEKLYKLFDFFGCKFAFFEQIVVNSVEKNTKSVKKLSFFEKNLQFWEKILDFIF